MDLALDSLVLATAWLHVIIAPYTKVEESFNLHAIHDVLMYGVGREGLEKARLPVVPSSQRRTKPEQYDHFTLPGAVPRTFVGNVLVAWLASPVLQLVSSFGFWNKFDIQIIGV